MLWVLYRSILAILLFYYSNKCCCTTSVSCVMNYPDTKPTSPFTILIKSSVWLRSNNYPFLNHWFHSTTWLSLKPRDGATSSQWGSAMKSPCMCIVKNRCLSLYDLSSWNDVNPKQASLFSFNGTCTTHYGVTRREGRTSRAAERSGGFRPHGFSLWSIALKLILVAY